MNKELYAILGTGLAVLMAIWMTWADTRAEIGGVRAEVATLNTRVSRIEGVLLERGEITVAESGE